MRIYFATDAEAEAFAAKVHAWMIENRPAYAESVKRGHTKRWAIPQRDTGEKGEPFGDPFIVVKERCVAALATEDWKRMEASPRRSPRGVRA